MINLLHVSRVDPEERKSELFCHRLSPARTLCIRPVEIVHCVRSYRHAPGVCGGTSPRLVDYDSVGFVDLTTGIKIEACRHIERRGSRRAPGA
jgi:hypothetical protein